MASSQQSRVLRCCSCRLFQAHQVTISLKWTCKACGKKQSFLRSLNGALSMEELTRGFWGPGRPMAENLMQRRLNSQAYGEGSGADCRRHVQKLNLLQGQVSEMALRSLEEAGQPAGEENTASQQTEHPSLQGGLQPSESRWLKYLREDTADRLEPDGECLQTEQPGRPFSKDLPRKRKWSPSTTQLPHVADVQDSVVTWKPQGHVSQRGKHHEGSSCEDSGTRSEPPHPAQQVRAESKWDLFLPPGNSPHGDTELQTSLWRDPRPTDQGPPSCGPGGHQLPGTTLGHEPCGESPEQLWDTSRRAEDRHLVTRTQKPPLVRMWDLFKTGEDFDDNL